MKDPGIGPPHETRVYKIDDTVVTFYVRHTKAYHHFHGVVDGPKLPDNKADILQEKLKECLSVFDGDGRPVVVTRFDNNQVAVVFDDGTYVILQNAEFHRA